MPTKFPRNFSLDRYLGNAWHLIPESGPDQVIQVRFSKKVARNVAEVNWHKTQQIDWNDDGTLVFSAKVKGLSEVSWWILGYGDQAEVVKPTALRKMIATHASQIAAKIRERLTHLNHDSLLNVFQLRRHRRQRKIDSIAALLRLAALAGANRRCLPRSRQQRR